jgi:4-alpha-glucanotransferase
MLPQRASGLLLHITSLPGGQGVGDLGPEARHFADFLVASGQSYWQILPLSPLDPGAGFSPYSSPSAFAGNPLLVSLEILADNGWLTADDLIETDPASQPVPATVLTVGPDAPVSGSDGPVVLPPSMLQAALTRKQPMLDRAADAFLRTTNTTQQIDFQNFCQYHAHWLDDYALFTVLQADLAESFWLRWPDAIRRRDPNELARQTERLRSAIDRIRAQQYFFFQQWQSLTDYCFARQVHFIGDVPIYVQFNSADVWANPLLFKLDADFQPLFVAGAPPDYFSEYGQRWGNPIYDWPEHRRTGFGWWLRRLRHQLSLYRLTRLDHFLGFAEYWEIPANEPTARVGQWVKAPIEAFMAALYRQLVQVPIIAEDLGAKTAEIQPHLRHYGIPGMRVVQFGFGDDQPTSTHAVHNHTDNTVVYSGTHDNNTTLGWFRELNNSDRQRLSDYFGFGITEENVVDQIVRLTMQSVGRLAILPVQDVLNLDETHRMNTPGMGGRSWTWRLEPGQLTDQHASKLLALSRMTGRMLQ